ncbi:MAG: phosphatidylserine decarboxylase family protein [Bacteroidetes bacterium]|nr:MAG: phosphatidylserine decarboxylase family protein [Bacteroidota bacterium]
MKIHREGRASVGIAVAVWGVLVVVAFVLGGLSWALGIGLLLLLGVGFIFRFFRYPARPCPADSKVVYAPCDGEVVVVEKVYEPEFLKADCMQISIFMSVWNVHANWYPISGRIAYEKYHKGKFLVAWLPKSSTENERSTVVVEREDGKQVLMRQVAGAVARRIVTYSKEGERVEQGGEFGFIKFGSRVDVYVPLDADIQVQVGDRTTAPQTQLAIM